MLSASLRLTSFFEKAKLLPINQYMILKKKHSPDASGLKLLDHRYLEFVICLEFDA